MQLRKSENLLTRSVIRNSRLCKTTDHVGLFHAFDQERNDLGWDFIENGTLYGVSGGFLFLTATTNAPSISRSNKLGQIDAAVFTEIKIKYLYKRVRPSSIASTGKIQFTTDADPIFDDTKSKTFEVISDGNWHSYTVDMSDLQDWIGNITNLKIFFALDGAKDDEVFLESVSIESTSFTVCGEDCDKQDEVTLLASSFDSENLNSLPGNYTASQLSSTRRVAIDSDPINLTNKMLRLSSTVSGIAGPSVATSLLSDSATGFASFRFITSSTEDVFRLKTSFSGDLDLVNLMVASGTNVLKYKQGNSYLDFETTPIITKNQSHSLFVEYNQAALLARISLNGDFLGEIPYLTYGPLSKLEFSRTNSGIGDLYIDNIIVVDQIDSSSCPGIGKQGSILAEPVYFSSLPIERGVNDLFIVDINDYGPVKFIIDPHPGLSPYELRDRLEREISSLDVGGYPYSEVEFLTLENRFNIKSGTYGFDSKVVLHPSLLAEQLGFFSGEQAIYESKAGREHASGFAFSNTFRAKTQDLLNLKLNDSGDFKFYQNPTNYSVEIGARFAGLSGKRNRISGKNKTLIDFYHRATEEGLIKKVYFHGSIPITSEVKIAGTTGQTQNGRLFYTGFNKIGKSDLPRFASQYRGVVDGDILVIDTPGYQSNGRYEIKVYNSEQGILEIQGPIIEPETDLIFRIENIVKVKQFRPKHDGTLSLVNEAVLGQKDSTLKYTLKAEMNTVDVNWYVHRGDLIGIYNADYLFVGNTANNQVDATYIEEDGDLVGQQIKVNPPKGTGISGLGLYGNNESYKQSRAAYDVVFPEETFIDTIEIEGETYLETKEYNLTAAIGNGFSVVATITGNHTHDFIDPSPNIIEQNQGINVDKLTDGFRYPENGVIGAYESNSSEASYFYITGDGELTGPGLVEYNNPGPTGAVHTQILDYETDDFRIEFNWPTRKFVHKFIIYFKEFPNAEGYFFEWFRGAGLQTDGSSPGFEKIGAGNTSYFTKVKLDNVEMSDSALIAEDSYYFQHFLTVFNMCPETNPDREKGLLDFHIYRDRPYYVLEKQFIPVLTNSIAWNCFCHRSTKISEMEIFSKVEASGSLDSYLDLHIKLSSGSYVKIQPEILQNGRLKYKIGQPVTALRLSSVPRTQFSLSQIEILPADDHVLYKDSDLDTAISSVDLIPNKGSSSQAKKIEIVNNTTKTANANIFVEAKNDLEEFIVLKTALSGLNTISEPEIGPPGYLIKDEDLDLEVSGNVAINSPCYVLKNLASSVDFFIVTGFNDESDFFPTHIDGNKWIQAFVNFPQPSGGLINGFPTGNLSSKFPGLSIARTSGTGSFIPSAPITQEVKTTWYSSSSFSAHINCIYDRARSMANPMGSSISIEDETGRRISIRKERVNYRIQFQQDHNYSRYIVRDSLTGDLETYLTYCTAGPNCSDPVGSEDGLSEYQLGITRIKENNQDLLYLHYVDRVNGTGKQEWSGGTPYVINLSTLSTPLVGSLRIVAANFWTPASGNLAALASAADTASSTGPFVRINSFSFGGVSSFPNKNYVFGPKQLSDINGSFQVNNIAQTPENKEKRVAIDLGKRYSLDIFDIYTKNNKSIWNVNNILFSKSNTNKPEDVIWGNSDQFDARWLLLSNSGSPYGTSPATSGVEWLDYLRVFPDITRHPYGQAGGYEWLPMSTVLTDNNFATAINQLDFPIIAVELASTFNMLEFNLFNRNNYEYKNTTAQEATWGKTSLEEFTLEPSYFTVNYSTSNLENCVWSNWIPYLQDNKTPGLCKRIAFKNLTFDSTQNLGGPAQYAASLKVSTYQKTNTPVRVSEYTESIDPTEFYEWFNVDRNELENIARLNQNELSYFNILFGGGPVLVIPSQTFNGVTVTSSGNIDLVFDEKTDKTADLDGASFASLWRLFGTLVVPSGQTANYNHIIPDSREISGFQINVDSASESKPNVMVVQNYIGGDPVLDSSWSVLTTFSGLTTQVPDSNGITFSYEFNQGSPFQHFFSAPVVSSGVRFVFSEMLYELGVIDKQLNIKDIQVFSINNPSQNTKLKIENDSQIANGGSKSLKVSFLAGNDGSASFRAGAAFEINPDPLLSEQDYFSIYIKISDPSKLDLENTKIRLGTSKKKYFEWNGIEIGGGLSTALEQYKFKFKNARVPLYSNYIFQTGSFTEGPFPDLKTESITFLEIELAVVEELDQDLIFWFDKPQIIRETFGIKGRENALYLNNSELIYFPTAALDFKRGYFEGVITPDWDKKGRLRQDVEIGKIRNNLFTLFMIVNGLDESISCCYREQEGLLLYVSSKEGLYEYRVGTINIIERYKPFKLGLAWDAESKIVQEGSTNSLILWINDTIIGKFSGGWDLTDTKDTYFIVGSRAFSKITGKLDVIHQPVTVLPEAANVTGGVEQILIANIPKQIPYQELKTLKEKVLLSSDGITYFPGTSSQLPLSYLNVAPGDSIYVWVRADLPVDTKNLQREGYLRCRWELID